VRLDKELNLLTKCSPAGGSFYIGARSKLINSQLRMNDKRASARFDLYLPIKLVRPSTGSAVTGETRNIGCDGFFCIVREPLGVKEEIWFTIFLPSPMPGCESSCVIKGKAEVVRIVADTSRASFGIGCRILEFRIGSQAAPKTQMAAYGLPIQTNGAGMYGV